MSFQTIRLIELSLRQGALIVLFQVKAAGESGGFKQLQIRSDLMFTFKVNQRRNKNDD